MELERENCLRAHGNNRPSVFVTEELMSSYDKARQMHAGELSGEIEDYGDHGRGNFKGYIENKRSDMINSEKCIDCFLVNSCCICDAVRNIYQSAIHDIFGTHIELFMHYKEWGRSSNTGKLMQVGLPFNCTTSIYGLPEDQQGLSESLSKQPSLILYPRSDARPISEYCELFHEMQGRVNLVVIDSTWPQSHAMDKSLPAHIPRVTIGEMILGPSEFLNRKQSKNKAKVSTLEAVVLALRALGYHTPEQLDAFTQSLRYGVDAMLRQGGKPPAYGNIIIPQARGCTGPFSIHTIHKPSMCLVCHATKDMGANFRNVGVRKKAISSEQGVLLRSGIHLSTKTSDVATGKADENGVYSGDGDGTNRSPYQSVCHDANDADCNSTTTPDSKAVDIDDATSSTVSYRVWRCSSCKEYFTTSLSSSA
ncbi:DTW domain-containing protein [archaeon]|nr:MAG: DTW domain-containing protein [archaeon]